MVLLSVENILYYQIAPISKDMEDNIRSQRENDENLDASTEESLDKSVEEQADEVYGLIREKIKLAFDKSKETYDSLSKKTEIPVSSLKGYMRGSGFFPTQKMIRVALLLEIDIFGIEQANAQKENDALPETLTQENVADFLISLGSDNKDIKSRVSNIEELLIKINDKLDSKG